MVQEQQPGRGHRDLSRSEKVLVAGSGFCTGSRTLPSEEVDRAFAMPIGKLRARAGIESVAYATDDETETTLGTKCARDAFRSAGCFPHDLDWIVATSETHHVFPSLAAQLHFALGAREDCGALDVGGACLGLIHALAVAQSLIASGHARVVAVVTADVHSRTLLPGRVAGDRAP
jgi:3-oxoacyl-[acyl-carrier-protein] synthase-3